MMDTYHVEYWTKNGSRMGLQVAAYCSQDVINYIEKMPEYYQLANFPEKINTN